MKTWYVDVGVVSDPDNFPGSKIGDIEYLFMNDLDNPTVFHEYVSLEKALIELSPCKIVWVPKVRARLREVMQMNASLPKEQREIMKLKGMI